MRILFKAFCGLVHILDRIFVYTVGRKVQYRERMMLSEDPVYKEESEIYSARTHTLYAIYEVPDSSPNQVFGIDHDEMVFEFDYTAVCEKVVLLKLGSILVTENGSKWRIIERRLKDHKYFGPGRLIAVGQRFALSETTRSEASNTLNECKQEN